jgi:hypothetical protein
MIPGGAARSGGNRRGPAEDHARPEIGPASVPALHSKIAALRQLGACAAIRPSAVCLEWSAGRAPTAGASGDETAVVLPAIAQVAGLRQIRSSCLNHQPARVCP